MAIPAVSFFCRHSLAYFLPSVILGPCPGIQVFIANNSLDSRLLARMTDEEGDGHSRGVFLLPSFSWLPRESSYVNRRRSRYRMGGKGRMSLDSRLLARMTTGRAVTAKWGGFPACRDGRERRAWILR